MATREINRRDGASPPKLALTKFDKGTVKMADNSNTTYAVDDTVINKIIHERHVDFVNSLHVELVDFEHQINGLVESHIELDLLVALKAYSFTQSEYYQLQFCIKKEFSELNYIKCLLDRSIQINKEVNRLLATEDNVLRIVIDPHDAGLITECIYNQVVIENYRVDFLVVKYCWEQNKHMFLVVECDGHDFHERTREQAKKDRSRDRKLQELGFTVFRFTGSEIWNDPMACAIQIMDWVG